MKKTILGLSLFLTFAVSTATQAQDRPNNPNAEKGPPPASELLKKMDANEDGKLSKKEVKGPLKKDFSKVDVNKDGFLSKSELEQMPAPKGRQGPPRRE